VAEVVVFVEVPSGSRNTYELDEELGFGYGNRSDAEQGVAAARTRATS
jgi:inorganic pyrophosphatase